MAPSNDEERRVQSYLQVQGAKLSPAELVAKVRVAMDELRITAAAVPAARFYDPPAPGEWSANEVLAHVADAGALFAERVRRSLDGEPQEPEAGRREEPPPRRPPAEWLSLLERDREAFFDRVLRVNPAAHPEAVIAHPAFGPLTWRETVLFIRVHDLDHARQLRKIAEAFGANE